MLAASCACGPAAFHTPGSVKLECEISYIRECEIRGPSADTRRNDRQIGNISGAYREYIGSKFGISRMFIGGVYRNFIGRISGAYCIANISGVHRKHFENKSGAYRAYNGILSGIYWVHVGHKSGLYRDCIGNISRAYRDYIGSRSEVYREYIGCIREHIGFISGVCRGYIGNISNTYREYACLLRIGVASRWLLHVRMYRLVF